MHKVMTRNRAMTRNERPGTRPPVRHDTRRPGSTPRRTTPGRSTSRVLPGQGAAPTGTGNNPSRATESAPSSRTPAVTGGPAAPTAPDAPHARAVASGTRPAAAAAVSAPPRPAPHVRPTDVFADRLLSVLSGQRPVHSMLRHTVGRAYDELAWLALRGPLRTRGTRPVVRDIGYFVPRPGAIEAFARIGAGDQLRAMAFRLECGPDHRWRCAAVELGGPRMPHTDDD
ncbi:Rv3235 family protein [Streptomyces sp. NPDC001020]